MLVVFLNSSWMLRRRKLGRKRKRQIGFLTKSRGGKRRKLKSLSMRNMERWMVGWIIVMLKNQIRKQKEVLILDLEMRMEVV